MAGQAPLEFSSRPAAPAMSRWLKVALIGCGALIVFVAVAVFGGVFGCLLIPNGREMVDAMRDGANIMVAGAVAPGTEALREAGCTTAFVLDVPQLNDIIARSKRGPGASMPSPREHPVVMCMPFETDASLTCDQIARVYGSAVGTDAPFGVVVRAGHTPEPACHGLFDASGGRVGDLEGDRRAFK